MTSTIGKLFRVKVLLVGEVIDGTYTFMTQYTAGVTDYDVYFDNGIIFTQIWSNFPALSSTTGRRETSLDKGNQVTCEVAVWVLHPSLLESVPPTLAANRFHDAAVVSICFQADSSSSLMNATDKWFPLVRFYFSTGPIVLVGRQSGTDTKDREAMNERIAAAGRKIGAADWFIYSADEGNAVTAAGDTLVWYGYHYLRGRRKLRLDGCVVL
ncbi:SubName: Full=Uncharacterized protein {ECO:0000313/EMBL:CCA70391.1} [Serendipita indica DSM 11827]|uniref:Uncharacterized protein n=1 Tax=Serendipita indica (strain DSM 11827) TaxID=1109443 RepID=G4TGE6_SERID|nr:SubName: Full=Uncharacterized protein {ECO:0000313/EMBL:CCA70391.1} [Serendipita indica DSM 11827]CCA70391.1 hypothetical protein PIIN_04330 [Serendipita indica DSM 11827]